MLLSANSNLDRQRNDRPRNVVDWRVRWWMEQYQWHRRGGTRGATKGNQLGQKNTRLLRYASCRIQRTHHQVRAHPPELRSHHVQCTCPTVENERWYLRHDAVLHRGIVLATLPLKVRIRSTSPNRRLPLSDHGPTQFVLDRTVQVTMRTLIRMMMRSIVCRVDWIR